MTRQTLGDPRLLKVQVERAAKALRTSIAGSPLWVCFFAFIGSKLTPVRGKVTPEGAGALALGVITATAIGQLVLRAYRRSSNHPQTISPWRLRLLAAS